MERNDEEVGCYPHNENGIPQAIDQLQLEKYIKKKVTIKYSIKKFISSTNPKRG